MSFLVLALYYMASNSTLMYMLGSNIMSLAGGLFLGHWRAHKSSFDYNINTFSYRTIIEEVNY